MRRSRGLMLGTLRIGGGAPVSVQSMTDTDTRDVVGTCEQIRELALAGCDAVRVALPDQAALAALPGILAGSSIPVVADIHFDYRLALGAIRVGAHGIRINPGNIGSRDRVRQVAVAAAERGVPIRIGVNSGSLDQAVREKHGGATAQALCESALLACRMLEQDGCSGLKVSLKASDVATTVAACRLFATRTDYPLHLGVTEAGTLETGTIKSAVGIGALLLDGIGDTLRVSLTASPLEEVRVGIRILEAVGLREARPDIVSCPTCGRTRVALVPIVQALECEIARIKSSGGRIGLGKIAVMGCAVNGPGEAREADLGIAAGDGYGVLFRHGKVVRRVAENELLQTLLAEIAEATTPA